MPQIKGIAVNWRFGSKGYPEPATDIELLGDSIYTILKTIPGERVYRPTFGCNLARLLFTNMSKQAQIRAANEAREAIRMHEKRVVVDDVLIERNTAANTISISIVWSPLGNQAQQRRTEIQFEGGG
jgi:phage baseplate assembly protein W